MKFDAEKHIYSEGGIRIPSVTQILKEGGLVNLDFIPADILAAAADLGHKVHSMTELYDANDLNFESLHPALEGYLRGWVKFKDDYKVEILETECQLFHKVYRYAGRVDRIAMLQAGKFYGKVLIDIKSGTEQKTHEIQTAGYELLYNQGREKKDQIRKRFIVHLRADGSYFVREHKNPNDKNVFLACLTITNYRRSL